MRDPVEIESLLAQTQAFVLSDPTSIVLRRMEEGSDGAGGSIDLGWTYLEPQTVKIQQLPSRPQIERYSPAGKIVRPTHQIVAMPAVDMANGDSFKWQGETWGVVYVDGSEEHVLKAEVVKGGH